MTKKDYDHNPHLLKEITESHAEVDDLKKERSLREKFVSTLSHDIRSPLSIARISAELLQKNPKDLIRHTNRIMKAIDKADAMIVELLNANKMTSESKQKLDLSYCDLEKIAASIIDDFLLNEKAKVTIKVLTPAKGHWDIELVRRILENLISNAIKYGDPQRNIEITINQKDGWASIKVHNFGNPIEPKIQESIFNISKRGDTKGKEGWGLGLTTVKDFTEILGGNISVSSSETSGTTFEVLLPLS